MNSDDLFEHSKAASDEIHVERDGETLRWRIGRERNGTPSAHFIETECGLYSVCDVYLGERKTAEAWGRSKRGGQTVQLAVGLASREDAVKVCEAHAVGYRVPQQQLPRAAEG